MNTCPKCRCLTVPSAPDECPLCRYVERRNAETSPFAADARLSMRPVYLAVAVAIGSLLVVITFLHADPFGVTKYQRQSGADTSPSASLAPPQAGGSLTAPAAASFNR